MNHGKPQLSGTGFNMRNLYLSRLIHVSLPGRPLIFPLCVQMLFTDNNVEKVGFY